MKIRTAFRALALTTALAAFGAASSLPAYASDALPGKGVVIHPGQDNIDGENFQTILVIKALKDLGYDVKPVKNAKYPALHLAVSAGDLTFMADHWNLLHESFYQKSGGDAKLVRNGNYLPNCAQGYLIDKKTADKYKITDISQLSDPKLAKLFDANNDGKADLAGCVPGWGCERVIEHQMDAFGLRKTVSHNQGEYSAIMADTISRYNDGKSILYYTWSPYWVSGVLVPNKDVVWLQVPKSANPDGRDTALPNGKNYGFEMNTQLIVSNKAFNKANPAAAKLFDVMTVSVNDVSAQNLLMQQKGEGGWKAAERHADNWIKHNQAVYDGWIAAAKAAAK